MKLPKIILIGGGGHCISCIDVIESTSKFEISGILDLRQNIGKSVLGIPIINTDDDLEKMKNSCDFFLITLGQIKTAEKRILLYERIKNNLLNLATVISSFSHVSRNANLGDGTIVMHGVTINAMANVGSNCIINNHSLIEHGVTIGDHCHISTGAMINGDVNIGNGVFIGSNVTCHHSISIGNGAVIGAGTIVRKDVPPHSLFFE
jgi:sugar O-acyltransferase (sialic acid O-acetyltransferase NeuD family)